MDKWEDEVKKVLELNRHTAILPSPDDERDYAEPIVSVAMLPERAELPLPSPILDQGQYPYCGGATAAGAASGFYKKHFSMTWAYAWAKRYDGIPDLPGTYGRAVCKAIQKHGCALEKHQPHPSLNINHAAADEALNYRAGEYNRVRTLIDMKAALARGRYLFIASYVTAGNWGWNNGGWLGEPYGDYLGGHLYLGNGYDNDLRGGHFLGVNSWGPRWGDNGKLYLPYDHLRQTLPEYGLKAFIEAWAVDFVTAQNWISHYQKLINIKRRLWAL